MALSLPRPRQGHGLQMSVTSAQPLAAEKKRRRPCCCRQGRRAGRTPRRRFASCSTVTAPPAAALCTRWRRGRRWPGPARARRWGHEKAIERAVPGAPVRQIPRGDDGRAYVTPQHNRRPESRARGRPPWAAPGAGCDPGCRGRRAPAPHEVPKTASTASTFRRTRRDVRKPCTPPETKLRLAATGLPISGPSSTATASSPCARMQEPVRARPRRRRRTACSTGVPGRLEADAPRGHGRVQRVEERHAHVP